MSNTITLSRDRMQIGDGLPSAPSVETRQLPETDDSGLGGNARSTRKSSNKDRFLARSLSDD